LTGTAAASCNCDRVVWNDLLRSGDCVRSARIEEARRGTITREAMVTEAVERLFGDGEDVDMFGALCLRGGDDSVLLRRWNEIRVGLRWL
jgi:hypothetical protein